MKEEVQSDEEIEAMFHKLKFGEPQLECESSKRISKMCVNPQCQKSLICNQVECQSCGFNIHPACPSVSLSNLTYLVNQTILLSKQFNQRTQEIQNNYLKRFNEQRIKFQNESFKKMFTESQTKILDKIFNKKASHLIHGKDAQEFCLKMNQSFKKRQKNFEGLLLQYKQNLQKQLDDFIKLKSHLIWELAGQHSFESNILTSEQEKQYLNTILQKPKQLKLLFRGSEHNFSPQKFHLRCDNIPHTVTLVKTESGKIIGGFSQYKWNEVQSGQYVQDENKKAFLFSIDQKKKIVPKNKERIIHCDVDKGPCFGYQDLWICKKEEESCCDFPDQYNYEGSINFDRNNTSFEKFTGSTTSKFKYIDYEVFQVIR